MTEVVGLHRCNVAAGRPSAFAMGQFYFVMVAKRECSDSECGVEALAPAEWAEDFGYGDLQDALTAALQDCDADYVDGVETALLLHHPDLNADVKGALALRPVSPTDGRRLLDGRYRGVSIPFSVFPLALPELGQGCFGFMLHNPSERSILSLGDCLIEARFSSERFVFHALASSFFRGCRKCLCDIDGSGAFVDFRIVMPSGEVWSLDVVDLIVRRGSELANGAGDDADLAAVIEKTANKGAEDEGVKRFLAIYALGREGDMPAGVVWDELPLESFDAVAVVWSDKAVAFIKGGYQTDGAVFV